jgi:uncharacterized membrane protein YdbT with pleckstrin-like domain
MSYVTKVLNPGERVIAMGRKHWIIYSKAAAMAIAGVVVIAFGNGIGSDGGFYVSMAGLVIIAFSALAAFGAWFEAWTTEIAVTNRRVIQKKGFIQRNTSEMNMDKVESVIVDQSLLGRILDYGSIGVRGTGAGMEGLKYIAKPLALRSAIVVPDQQDAPATPAPAVTPPAST